MSGSNWADLPKELLEIIGKHLNSHIDVYRFRSVCSSWRTSVSPSFRWTPCIRLKLPPPVSADAFFSPFTICRLEQVDHNSTSNSSSSSSSSSMVWLNKVEESIEGKMQLLIPLSNRQIKVSPGNSPKLLNLLNFRLIELAKAYSLKRASGRPVLGIDKVVLFPNASSSTSSSDFGLIAIFHEGKLGYWKNGDEYWSPLGDWNFHYDDIIVYKGQFYVVDRGGTVSWIDSSLNLIQYSPPLRGCGNRKNLVESCGELYIVNRYLDGERRNLEDNEGDQHRFNRERSNIWDDFFFLARYYPKCRANTIDIKVYKLDEEWGTWVDVKSLGDRVFVVSNEFCFSVSAKEFAGWEGNCIYFIDPNDEDLSGELSGYDARVFRLDDHSISRASYFLGRSILKPLPQIA